jgi:hypothetical protein
VWQAQVSRWGCDRCREYLDSMGPVPVQPAAPAAPSVDAIKAAKRAAGVKMMVLGGALLLLGIIITSATHQRAVDHGGGTYVIAYGPIVVGAIRFLQGLFYLA